MILYYTIFNSTVLLKSDKSSTLKNELTNWSEIILPKSRGC